MHLEHPLLILDLETIHPRVADYLAHQALVLEHWQTHHLVALEEDLAVLLKTLEDLVAPHNKTVADLEGSTRHQTIKTNLVEMDFLVFVNISVSNYFITQ